MKRSAWRVKSSSPRHQNPYFSVMHSNVVVPGGDQRDYYTIRFPRPAVGVVARRGTDVLLIHQFRFTVNEYVWAIPSGRVSEGEPLESAALRELEEETGYTAGSIREFMHCYASYGCSDQRFEIFVADDVSRLDSGFDRTEVIDVRWFSRTELIDLVEHNGIVDNLSLSPLLLLLLRGEKV